MNLMLCVAQFTLRFAGIFGFDRYADYKRGA